MVNNPFFKPLAILGIITLGVIIWYSLPRPTPLNINLVGNTSGTVTLALTPATSTLKPSEESTLTLKIDGGTSHVTAAQIELTYDSTKIATPTITLGDFLPSVLSAVSTTGDKIAFTVAAAPSSGGVTGSGTIATIKFTQPTVGTSNLTFTENTLVTVTEAQTNMLKSVTDATITVATVESSAEPSVTPSTPANPSPSIQPSIQPSIKPSVKPTSTPKPSPTTPAPSLVQSPRPTISGSLNDIFTGDIDTTTEDQESTKPGFFQTIMLGWQAIFERLRQLFD